MLGYRDRRAPKDGPSERRLLVTGSMGRRKWQSCRGCALFGLAQGGWKVALQTLYSLCLGTWRENLGLGNKCLHCLLHTAKGADLGPGVCLCTHVCMCVCARVPGKTCVCSACSVLWSNPSTPKNVSTMQVNKTTEPRHGGMHL